MVAATEYLVPTVIFSIIVSALMILNIYRFDKLRRQKYHLVTARFPLIVLFYASSMILNVVILPLLRVTWGAEGEVPCKVVILINQVFVAIAAASGIARIYLLVYTHRIQKHFGAEGTLLRDTDSFSDRPSISSNSINNHTWLMRHQAFGRPAFIIISMAVIFILVIAGPLMESLKCIPEKTSLSRGGFMFAGITTVVLFLFMLKTHDAMHIRTELQVMALLVALRVFFENMHLSIGRAGPFGVYEIIGTFIVLGLFSVNIIYPQYLVKKSLEAVGSHEGKDMTSFLTETKCGFEHFKGYLELEFSVENLLFWRDVKSFRKSPSLRKAYLIYKLYIAQYGTLEINIPGKVKNNVTLLVGQRCQSDPHLRKRFNNIQTRHTRSFSSPLPTVTPSRSDKQTNVDNSQSGKTASMSEKNTEDGRTGDEYDISEKEQLSAIFDDAMTSIEMLLVDGPFLRFLASPEYAKWKIHESQVGLEMIEVQRV